MINPKEKAIELFNKYADEINFDDIYSNYKKQSKQCALIAVEEIINSIDIGFEDYKGLAKNIYWNEVKQEIENL